MAVLAVCAWGAVDAAEVEYTVEVEVLHSDNLNLDEVDPVSDTVVVPRLVFRVREEGARIALEARGELERRHYVDDSFPDETRGEFAGQLDWTVVPGRLNLVLEDYLSQEPISFEGARDPGNLQRVNVLLGGPTFFARLGPSTRLQVDVRAADSRAEVTPGFDGQRYSVAAALQRQFNRRATGSLNVVSSRAEFDAPATVDDYTRHDAFGRYEAVLRNLEYEFDLGYSWLDRQSESDDSITIGRARVQWQATPRSRLRLRARHQFTDGVQDLVIRLQDPDQATIPALAEFSSVTPGVFRERYVDGEYRYAGARLGVRVRPVHRRLRFLDRPASDRDEDGGYARVDYRLRPRTLVFAEAFVRDRAFRNQPRDDTDRVYGVGIEHQLSRHWSWRAAAFRNTRDSNLAGQSYDENAVQVAVAWTR
ncbi:hypothetical protein GCM10028862_00050 [Luteimonas pelagia]